jgi:hypothetical protein
MSNLHNTHTHTLYGAGFLITFLCVKAVFGGVQEGNVSGDQIAE